LSVLRAKLARNCWLRGAGEADFIPKGRGNPSKANASRVSRPPIVVSPTTGDVNDVDQAINELVGTLFEMLRRLTRKAGDLLRADRTSIFLLDPHRRVLGTVVADDGEGGGLVIDIPVGKGIAGLAATSSQVINVPFDVYNDPRSEEAKKTDHRTGYRTYTILAFPVLNKQKDLVAVVQLINKLKPNHDLKTTCLEELIRVALRKRTKQGLLNLLLRFSSS
jgi:hypothetical protein